MTTVNKTFRQYQNIIISVSILLFCVMGTVFGVVPAALKVQEMVGAVRLLREETKTLANKLETLSRFDEVILRQQLTDVLSAVPADRSFPTLFQTVEAVAAQTGVAIKNMDIGGTSLATPSASKISAAEKKLGTRTVPFTVTVEGPIGALEQFISLSPNVRRLLRIKIFSITFPKDQSTVTTSFDMDAFYEPLPTSLGTAKSTLPSLTEQDTAVIAKLSGFPLTTSETAELPPPVIGRVKQDPFSP